MKKRRTNGTWLDVEFDINTGVKFDQMEVLCYVHFHYFSVQRYAYLWCEYTTIYLFCTFWDLVLVEIPQQGYGKGVLMCPSFKLDFWKIYKLGVFWRENTNRSIQFWLNWCIDGEGEGAKAEEKWTKMVLPNKVCLLDFVGFSSVRVIQGTILPPQVSAHMEGKCNMIIITRAWERILDIGHRSLDTYQDTLTTTLQRYYNKDEGRGPKPRETNSLTMLACLPIGFCWIQQH